MTTQNAPTLPSDEDVYALWQEALNDENTVTLATRLPAFARALLARYGVQPVQGQEISIDVSTGDGDAGLRAFGTLTGEDNGGVWLAEGYLNGAPVAAQPTRRAYGTDTMSEYGIIPECDTAPQPAVDPDFVADLARSRAKYPGTARMFDGLMGEVDELRRAYAGDGDIRAEAFDVAACAYRIATEGDAGGNTLLTQPAASAEPYRCEDCPPVGYPTDETRCTSCDRRTAPVAAQPSVSAELYLALTEAMGYDAGRDGLEYSPEQWAQRLHQHYQSAQPSVPACPQCGTRDVSLERTCHNSACASYAKAETVYEGWKTVTPPADGQTQQEHDLFREGDPGLPDTILDRNGDVVLGMCRRCGRAEAQLAEPCVIPPADGQDELRAIYAAARYAGWMFSKHADGVIHMEPLIAGTSQAADGMEQQDADKVDAERLDWLEEQTRKSATGTSFDYVRLVEDGHVVEHGYRFMRCHFLGERKDSLRAAIDAVRAQQGGQ